MSLCRHHSILTAPQTAGMCILECLIRAADLIDPVPQSDQN